MRKFSTKILISIIVILVLSAATFAGLSFTFADDEGDAADTKEVSSTVPKTIIDYIIDNSINGAKDKTYHILELGSSDTPSDLQKLVSSDNFRKLVINGNKTKDYPDDMPEDAKIEYIYYNATEGNLKKIVPTNDEGKSTVATDADIVSAINLADLVYLSNDPSNGGANSFKKGNDITEDIKIALSSYAVGDHKPLIIDSHNQTQQYINMTTNNMSNIATKVFKRYGSNYSTYKWSDSVSINDFMDLTKMEYLYLPVDGSASYSAGKWTEVSKASGKEYIAKVLTIQNGSSDTALSNMFKADFTTNYDDMNDDTDDSNTYVLDNTNQVYINGYLGRSRRPNAVKFDTLDLSSAGAVDDMKDPSKYDLSMYDFILIEKGTSSVDFAANLDSYNALVGAMYANVHILYNSSLISGDGNISVSENTARNYKYVYDKVGTSTDTGKYGYILVGSRIKMASYAITQSSLGVKDIADTINAGTFRGIGGNSTDDAANVYTALEIEPGYPISLDLAAKLNDVKGYNDPLSAYNGQTKTFLNNSIRGEMTGDSGFYYLRTWDVRDLTSDEISYDGENSLTSILDGSATNPDYFARGNAQNFADYYDWTLSKAKVAHALGVSSDEVRVVHMSSTEFACSKDTLLDNYDMIYIGGNNSMVMSDTYLHSPRNGLTYYRMYRHNGDTYSYNNGFTGYQADTIGVQLGNDFTDDKVKELKEYVAAGMPVVIGDDVTSAYENGTDIDPDSNVYDFLDYASAGTLRYNNIGDSQCVLWNFNSGSTIKVANINNKYGKTFGGYATIFSGRDYAYNSAEYADADVYADKMEKIEAGTEYATADTIIDEKYLSDLIKNKQRPRLAVTSTPKRYVEGDKTTWLDDGKLEFTYKINGESSGATAYLYIDDDGNTRFTEDEMRKPGADGKLTYTLPSDYYGVVYWKLVATDGVKSASTTGVCKIKRKPEQEKMVVNLLEIWPAMEPVANNKSTLLFCYECQGTKGILHGNRSTAEAGKYSRDALTSLEAGFKDKNNGRFSETNTGAIDGTTFSTNTYEAVVNKIKNDPKVVVDMPGVLSAGTVGAVNDYLSYTDVNNKLGVHEHKFGIVKYYENLTIGQYTGNDDITTNWFDEIRDDYIVNTTILTTREYENLCALVNSIYAGKSEEDVRTIVSEFSIRQKEYETYYKVMRQLINGNYNESYKDSKGNDIAYVKPSDKLAFESFMLNSSTDPDNPGLGLTREDLAAYGNASKRIDEWILKDDNGETSANIILRKSNATKAQILNEIRFQTNPNLERTERSYYDMFSMITDNNDVGEFYTEYSKRYQIWRNAKMYEQYFKNQALKYSLLASVNYIPDGAEDSLTAAQKANINTYQNKINLKDTFNCIVFGAADEYNRDDINDTGCYPILDYIDDDGSVILFHDTLTVWGNSTRNMTQKLSEAFGQNARHMEYFYSDKQQTQNDLTVTFCGATKKFKVDSDVTEVEINAVQGEASDKKIAIAGYNASGTQTHISSTINLSKNITKADLFIIYNRNTGDFTSVSVVPTAATADDTHNIVLTPYLCENTADKTNPWNRWYTPPIPTADYAHYDNSSTLKKISLLVDGNPVDLPWQLDGSGDVSVPNASFTVSNPTVLSTYGTGFDTKTEIAQKLSLNVTDGSGNPVSGMDASVVNNTTGETFNGTTAGGVVTYEFSNMVKKDGSKPQYRVKAPYKDSEYYFSPTLGNNTPNINALNIKTSVAHMKGSGGSISSPFKYTWLDLQLENGDNAEFLIHAAQDARQALWNAKIPTDRASQVNKGIITMYPFTIGSELKISGTTSQSYALDIENPDVIPYYALAGGSSGTGSSMFAADPHNGQDNYFVYQYGNVTYTGAGHGSVTGIGRDNNDERRLFINIIVNTARKSSQGPDLTLHDIDSSMVPDADGNSNLFNTYVERVDDAESNYKYTIEDISDPVYFSVLPKMATGTGFGSMQIFFDVNREGSNIDNFNPGEDYMIFNSLEDSKNAVGSERLKRINAVEIPTDQSRIGLSFGITPDGIITEDMEKGDINNLKLKQEYFDKSDKAHIVVIVYDSKGVPATKTIRIEYKPTLLDLN